MTLHAVPRIEENLKVHVIPVPVGMDVYEAWNLIKNDVLLVHPNGEPGWAAIMVDEEENIVAVIK